MRTIVQSALLLGVVALAGCGGAGEPTTDPADLKPLSDEQLQQIAAEDAAIEEEESTGGGMIPQK
ncbi:hypothetical protein [Tautonia sociabilis]|uniref:Secreted protein n=1 Tax=Tautonia sociabilis TaxID=2080755 RepID=A0A432MMX1_9BACT|nr:hypothetical protein [Tautonia sociabilis]RUL88791.1 hypothetical protein TsocGM_05390 [Tautonia sociabilis]